MDKEDQQEFLEDLGLKESGMDRLIHGAYQLPNRNLFYCWRKRSVRLDYRRGTKLHRQPETQTDFEKGFIRAEVISFEDYEKHGSEAAVKEAGRFRIEERICSARWRCNAFPIQCLVFGKFVLDSLCDGMYDAMANPESVFPKQLSMRFMGIPKCCYSIWSSRPLRYSRSIHQPKFFRLVYPVEIPYPIDLLLSLPLVEGLSLAQKPTRSSATERLLCT